MIQKHKQPLAPFSVLHHDRLTMAKIYTIEDKMARIGLVELLENDLSYRSPEGYDGFFNMVYYNGRGTFYGNHGSYMDYDRFMKLKFAIDCGVFYSEDEYISIAEVKRSMEFNRGALILFKDKSYVDND